MVGGAIGRGSAKRTGVTALSPLASILAAFSTALLEAATRNQSEALAQDSETPREATFTSVMEKLLEKEQPGQRAQEAATATAASGRTSDEEPDSGKSKAKASSESAIPTWMTAATTSPSVEPVAAKAASEKDHVAREASGPGAETEKDDQAASTATHVQQEEAEVTTAPTLDPEPKANFAVPHQRRSTGSSSPSRKQQGGTAPVGETALGKKAEKAEISAMAGRPEKSTESRRTGKPEKAETPEQADRTKEPGQDADPVSASAAQSPAPIPPVPETAPAQTAMPAAPADDPTASRSAEASSTTELPLSQTNEGKPAAGRSSAPRHSSPDAAAPVSRRQAAPQEPADAAGTSGESTVRTIDEHIAATIRAGAAVSAASASIVAFRARLVPLETEEKPVPPSKPLPASPAPAAQPSADSPRETSHRDATATSSQEASAPTQAQSKQEDRDSDRQSSQQQPQPRQPAAIDTQQTATQQPAQSVAVSPTTPRLASTAARADADPAPQPATPAHVTEAKPAAVRDLRLEVSGADQRVEVRLTERAGEVRVAVRTPDARLAADLRENLPTLSSRLEQTGFRAEGLLHDSASASGIERRDLQQTGSGGSGEGEQGGRNQGEQQRGQQQQQQHPQRQRTPEEISESKTKRKDFAWFLSPQA